MQSYTRRVSSLDDPLYAIVQAHEYKNILELVKITARKCYRTCSDQEIAAMDLPAFARKVANYLDRSNISLRPRSNIVIDKMAVKILRMLPVDWYEKARAKVIDRLQCLELLDELPFAKCFDFTRESLMAKWIKSFAKSEWEAYCRDEITSNSDSGEE
jgi:hypothetical protein